MNKPSHAFDLSRFAASASGLTPAIQVCMPQTAFQIHPDRERTVCGIYLCLFERKWWMVAADVVEDEAIEIQNLWRADLYEGRKLDGQRFVLPVTLPLYSDQTDWHDTLSQAVRLARKKWITVESDKTNKCFNVTSEKPIKAGQDDWPDDEFSDLLEQAFHGRIIYTRKDAVAKLKKPARRNISEDLQD